MKWGTALSIRVHQDRVPRWTMPQAHIATRRPDVMAANTTLNKLSLRERDHLFWQRLSPNGIMFHLLELRFTRMLQLERVTDTLEKKAVTCMEWNRFDNIT